MTNRADAQYETTRYEYWTGTASTNVNGLPKRIISPEGVILLEKDYFGSFAGDFPQFAAYDGFLKAQVDAVGVTANLAHDPDEGTGILIPLLLFEIWKVWTAKRRGRIFFEVTTDYQKHRTRGFSYRFGAQLYFSRRDRISACGACL